MKLKLFLVALVFSFMSSMSFAAEQVKYRLVLQVSEDSVDRLMVAINNAKHVQEEFGPENVEVEIVVFSAGVQTLKYYSPIPVADRVKEAKYEGIRISVCDYSMRKAKLKPADMLSEITYVKSGVVEIMEKVKDGWIYVRP